MRDEFPASVVKTLSNRVAGLCSRPGCYLRTTGPHSNPGKFVNIGKAAHITAAAAGGPRFDGTLTPEQRGGIENGIWLCSTCADLIDKDPDTFTVEVLRRWKADAEAAALRELYSGRPQLPHALVDISNPIMLGATPSCMVGDQVLPMAPVRAEREDYSYFCGAFAFRILMQPRTRQPPTILHGFGVEILESEPVPKFGVMYGAYPTSFNLYLLEFTDPRRTGIKRQVATQHIEISGDGFQRQSIQPLQLDESIADTFDLRLCPQDPGFYKLRLFAIVSQGPRSVEHDIVEPFKIVIPSEEEYCPNPTLPD